jgi:hypothetical protein
VTRLVELDPVSGRIAEEGLPSASHRRRVGNRDATVTELSNRVVEVMHVERKVLAD